MNEEWIYYKIVGEGEYCGLDGINIWDHQWKTDHETIFIKYPNYGEEKRLKRYWIEIENRNVEFAAGEFSNGVWGIYTRHNSDPKPKQFLERNLKKARELINEFDILQRIRNGAPETEYDLLTAQILSDILNKKGNREIIKNSYDLLTKKYGEEKIKLKIADFDLSVISLANEVRKNIC